MKKISKQFSFFLLLSLLSFISLSISLNPSDSSEDSTENLTELPTLRFSLDGKNLGELEKILVTKLLKAQDISIPPIELSEVIQIIGKVDFVLNNTIFTITNNSDAEVFISFAEDRNINFILNFLQGELTFDYYLNSVLLSSKGNGTIILNNISLTLYNEIIQVTNYHEPYKKGPGLKINSLGVNNLDLDFKFSKNGTLEKFLYYFNTNIKGILVGVFENVFNQKDTLNKINEELMDTFENLILSFPVEFPPLLNSSDNINVSFSMNTPPLIKNQILEVGLEAELLSDSYIYDQKNNITLPSLINDSLIYEKNVINGIVSQFLFNNILDILYYYGKLNFVITNDTLGLSEINIGVISAIIPEITNGYKTNQKVEIYANAYDSPLIKVLNDNQASLSFKTNVQFFAYPPQNNTNKNINLNKLKDEGSIPVDGNTELQIDLNYYINDTDIQLSVKSLKMVSFRVVKSLVGDIDTDRVVKNFNTLTTLMITQINNKIKEMIAKIVFPITVMDINLMNLIVESYDNYFKISLSPFLEEIIDIFQKY